MGYFDTAAGYRTAESIGASLARIADALEKIAEASGDGGPGARAAVAVKNRALDEVPYKDRVQVFLPENESGNVWALVTSKEEFDALVLRAAEEDRTINEQIEEEYDALSLTHVDKDKPFDKAATTVDLRDAFPPLIEKPAKSVSQDRAKAMKAADLKNRMPAAAKTVAPKTKR